MLKPNANTNSKHWFTTSILQQGAGKRCWECDANAVWQRRQAMSSQTTQAHSTLEPSLVYRYRHTTGCQLPGPVHPSGQFKLLLQHRWGTIHINSPTHPYSCPHLFCTRNRKITASVCCRERVNCDERRQISAVHLTKCCTFSCRCCCGISLTVKHRDYPLPFPSFPEQQNKQTKKSHCGPSR